MKRVCLIDKLKDRYIRSTLKGLEVYCEPRIQANYHKDNKPILDVKGVSITSLNDLLRFEFLCQTQIIDKVEYIYISNNSTITEAACLRALGIFKANHLKELYIEKVKSSLQLIRLIGSMYGIQLKELTFKSNQLHINESNYIEFIESLSAFINISYLDLSGNIIKGACVGDILKINSELTTLDLSSNPLGISTEYEYFPVIDKSKSVYQIERLNLDNCLLTCIASIFAGTTLNSLKGISLYNNRLNERAIILLSSNTSLTSLKSLNIGSNHIGTEGFFRLYLSSFFKNLSELNLSGNNIDVLSKKHKSSKYVIELNSNNIDNQTKQTKYLTFTQKNINLANNPIKDSFFDLRFPSVEVLNLTNCMIDFRIHQTNYWQNVRAYTWENFAYLEELYIGNNWLEIDGYLELTSWGEFPSLRHLDVSNNSISGDIHRLLNITRFEKLETLVLNHNKVNTSPRSAPDSSIENIKIPKHLSNLMLNGVGFNLHYLKQLVKCGIKNIKHLTLKDNCLDIECIEFIVNSIGKSAINIAFSDNDRSSGLPEHLLNDFERLKKHLAVSRVEEKVYGNRVRFSLIGQPYSGKSTIFKKIFNNEYTPNSNEARTTGIVRKLFKTAVTNNLLKDQEIKHVELDIWDFGGNELQHMCHNLFMSGNAIYGLVIDKDTKDSHIRYWLNMVNHFASNKSGGVVVLPILNQRSNEYIRWNAEEYRSDFISIDLQLPILVNPNFVLSQFNLVATLEVLLANYSLSLVWSSIANLQQIIPKWEEDYLSIDDFDNRLDELGFYDDFIIRATSLNIDVSREDYYEQVTNYLHNIGIIHAFPSLDIAVLNYRWLERGVYLVLAPDDPKCLASDDPVATFKRQLRERAGVFKKADLLKAWEHMGLTRNRRSVAGALFKLLQKDYLNLIYPLDDNGGYFVPAFLRELNLSSAKGYFDQRLSLHPDYIVRLESSFLPIHLLHQLLVKNYSMIKTIDGVRQEWSNAFELILEHGNSKGAEVTVVEEGSVIWILLHLNEYSRTIFLPYYYRIIDTAKHIGGLESGKALVPCPECKEINPSGRDDWRWFDLEPFQQVALHEKLPCDVCGREIKIKNLLNQYPNNKQKKNSKLSEYENTSQMSEGSNVQQDIDALKFDKLDFAKCLYITTYLLKYKKLKLTSNKHSEKAIAIADLKGDRKLYSIADDTFKSNCVAKRNTATETINMFCTHVSENIERVILIARTNYSGDRSKMTLHQIIDSAFNAIKHPGFNLDSYEFEEVEGVGVTNDYHGLVCKNYGHTLDL